MNAIDILNFNNHTILETKNTKLLFASFLGAYLIREIASKLIMMTDNMTYIVFNIGTYLTDL